MASILAGLITVLVWFYSGMSDYLFEVFPGFIVSSIVLLTVSKATGGPSKEVSEKYRDYIEAYRKINEKR